MISGRSSALAAGAIVVALMSACNTGDHTASGRYQSAGIGGVGSATIHIVIMPWDLLEGASPGVSSSLLVWIDEPDLTDGTLWVEDGSGWREYSYATFLYWQPGEPLGINQLGPGTRYQVRGKILGQAAWSNEVVERSIDWTRDWGIMSFSDPPSVVYGAAPVAFNVTQASWTSGPPATTSYLLTLWRRDVWSSRYGLADSLLHVTTVETANTTYRFGDLSQREYTAPPPVPLAAGEYALSVMAIDATGWGFASSNVGPPPPWAQLRDRESYFHFDAR